MGGYSENVIPGLIVMFFGFLGAILSYVEQYMVDNGYLLDEYMADTITLPDLQIVTVTAFILIGVVVAVLYSRT